MDATRVKRVAVFLICSVALSACAEESVVDDDHVDAVPYLVAEPEMRLGDVDDPDVGFSRVGGVEVDRDANIYVLEVSVPEIRVFDPDGALIRTIGRRGEGPGEFERAPRFGVVGDTVWTVTFGRDRITLFDTFWAVETDELGIPWVVRYTTIVDPGDRRSGWRSGWTATRSPLWRGDAEREQRKD